MQPVAPGQGSAEFIFSYVLPYERRLDFVQPVSYPVSAVVLLSPEPGPKLQAEGLQDMGVQQIGRACPCTLCLGAGGGGRCAAREPERPAGGLLGNGFAAAQPRPCHRSGGRRPGADCGRAAVVPPERAAPGPGITTAADGSRARRLIGAIAGLDDDFAAGRMEEAVYRERREALKRSLLAISGE